MKRLIMKILSYSLVILFSVLLSGCYKSNMFDVYYAPEMETLSPIYDIDGNAVILAGWADQTDKDIFYFEVSSSQDFSGADVRILKATPEITNYKANYYAAFTSRTPGRYYYRMCSMLDFEGSVILFAPNVESFTVDY